MENSIVCELVWKSAKSSKGNEFQALFAVLPNGKEIIVGFDKKVYYILNKNSK